MRICYQVKKSVLAILIVFAIWFPSIWFIDMLFALGGGRTAKLAAWGVLIVAACSLATRLQWVTSKIPRYTAPSILGAVISELYFLGYHLLSPPHYNYQQAVSLCILVPLSLYLGLSCRNTDPGVVLAVISGSAALIVYIGIFKGNVDTTADSFQSFLWISTSDLDQSTGYQGLTAMAGFLPIYILSKLRDMNRHRFMALSFFALALYPVLIVGGRAPLIGLVTASGFYLLQYLIIKKSLVRTLLYLCVITIFLLMLIDYNENAPLGIKRLLWLNDDSVIQSSMRIELWSNALKNWVISLKTVLIGSGPQSFPLVSNYNDPGMYPHNFVLELLSEYGLIGLSLIIFAPIIIIFYQFKKGLSHVAELSSPLFLIYIFSISCFSGGLQSIWPLFFVVGWLGAENSTKNSPKKI
jgi:hypothetical protein